jgi:hypothetical protein
MTGEKSLGLAIMAGGSAEAKHPGEVILSEIQDQRYGSMDRQFRGMRISG